MKFPLVYTNLCFKQVVGNATVGSNSRCRLVVNSASCELQLPMNVPVPVGPKSCIVNCDAWFADSRLRQSKSTLNSVIVENRT
jgi:hypothetical protein